MANLIVGAIPPVMEAGAAQATGVHWSEQSASKADKASLVRLINTGAAQSATPAAAPAHATPAMNPGGAAVTGQSSQRDVLGRSQLYAALEKLRSTPMELMPGAAAQLMVQCYEYQFNVTAATHAAKTFEESVQTMTSRT
ncbi:MAG TPA: hypothetical protein VLC92_06520 [Rhodocyclaceae bacterium]|nr:hypothetical protein [Rhodocyclaceae bacterium]